MTSYEDFFAWCERQGLKNDKLIATAFRMTPQTVRNWKAKWRSQAAEQAKGEGDVLPDWVALACRGYEAARRASGDLVPDVPVATVSWFNDWRHAHGLDTLEEAGAVFGLTRQAVHNWFKRERMPKWLSLACIGYEQPGRAAQGRAS